MRPFLLALEQLPDPGVLRLVLASLALAAAALALAGRAALLLVHHWLAAQGTLGWIAGAAGGLAVLVLAVWLFLPLAIVIAGLFQEGVAHAVERRHYPDLPPPRGAALAAQLLDSLLFGARVLALQALTLVLALVLPGVGLLLGWAIASWAIARGLLTAVAMRRMSRAEAHRAWLAHRPRALLQGALLTALGTVPLLNLLVPFLGTAAMIHVLNEPVPPAGIPAQAPGTAGPAQAPRSGP
jgi:CysZ protein